MVWCLAEVLSLEPTRYKLRLVFASNRLTWDFKGYNILTGSQHIYGGTRKLRNAGPPDQSISGAVAKISMVESRLIGVFYLLFWPGCHRSRAIDACI